MRQSCCSVLIHTMQDFKHDPDEDEPSEDDSAEVAKALGEAPQPAQVARDRRLVAKERVALEERNIILPPQCDLYLTTV